LETVRIKKNAEHHWMDGRKIEQGIVIVGTTWLVMVLFWIWQWWRLDVSFDVRLDGAGVGRWTGFSCSKT
jgi:hypothetical protein